ncbi:FtsX-like permease family protein [Svornostia abyssi]|uniref:FtsX-like permease family protein n=1 Tax=Svornostia abyssi TaxID=2898438 RepID=A0ABY5PHW7_9ACTN|nr:FtsX-like permease family protein [Parviterribacteraceae bacterium J379]
MALTAATRKSVTDLTRRKARAVFTILTLAIAVASVSILAVPSLMERTMQREIASTRLADLTVTMRPLELSDAALREVARVPNVEAVQPKSIFSTRVYVGDRRQKALVIAVPDFAAQSVDVINVSSGSAPRDGELLTDSQNAPKEKYDGRAGDRVRVITADGSDTPLPITGTGQYLGGADIVANGGFAVFYATPETVARLSGAPGTTMLAMRLRDTSRPAAERTAAEVRSRLAGVDGFTGFADYPEIRAAGEYPGKALFEQVVSIMSVITILALLSALVLLSNTMSTLIGEQTSEIATMKAIGATRRQVRRVYRRTALLLGAIGAVLGVVLGVVLSNAVTSYFASSFYGIDPQLEFDGTMLAIGLVVGLVGPPLAATPAIRRASRLPVREALDASGSALGGQGRLDALLRRVRFLPRSSQIGLRGAARRKRRTAATAIQVALAVGTLLAVLALGTSVGNLTQGFFANVRWDITATTYASKPFDAEALRTVASLPGVAETQPLLTNGARVEGKNVQAWGLPDDPMYEPELVAGRWPTPQEVRSRARVAVIGQAVADTAGVGAGDTLPVRTAAGVIPVRVVGVTTNEIFQGAMVYLPLRTLQAVLGTPDAVNNVWVRSASQDRAEIDRLSTRLEDTLGAGGNQLTTEVKYVAERDQAASNSSLTTSISVLGLLIVAISMVGLLNAITMGVIERTREIGMLRCTGARARDVRGIFGTEGIVVALTGWLLGVPLGWLMAHGLVTLTADVADTDLAFVFPAGHLAVTFAGTIVLAVLVLLVPVRRAVRLRPGEALRYA